MLWTRKAYVCRCRRGARKKKGETWENEEDDWELRDFLYMLVKIVLLCHTLIVFKIYVFFLLMSDLSSLRSFSQSLWSIYVTVYEEESISWIMKFPRINKNKCCSSTSPGTLFLSLFLLKLSVMLSLTIWFSCAMCPKTKFNFSLQCALYTRRKIFFFRSRINRMEEEKRERERKNVCIGVKCVSCIFDVGEHRRVFCLTRSHT